MKGHRTDFIKEFAHHNSVFTMRFSSFATLTVSVLLAQCNAFNPITSTSRKTTVVQDTLRSSWTMMPDEPTPEVSFHFHVSHHVFSPSRLTICLYEYQIIVFRSILAVKIPMSNLQQLLSECLSLTPRKAKWTSSVDC